MTTLERGDQGDIEETWQAYYSERAQREYYFHPKTRIVTWILPDDENYHVPNDLNVHTEVETLDAERNEIPRDFVVVDNNHQHHFRSEPKMMSGQNLTVVMLVVSTIVTGISWGMYGGDSGTTELRGRPCVRGPLQILDSPMVVTAVPEYTSSLDGHGVGSITVEHVELREGLMSINPIADGTPLAHDVLTNVYKEEVDTPPNEDSTVATYRKEGDFRGTENSHDGEGSVLDLSRTQDTASSPFHVESHALIDSSEADEETWMRSNPDLNSTPTIITEPADEDASAVAVSHVQRRACYIPFAHVFSRICRQETRNRPLFNVDALVEALVML
jgi:hypothetical protein